MIYRIITTETNERKKITAFKIENNKSSKQSIKIIYTESDTRIVNFLN